MDYSKLKLIKDLEANYKVFYNYIKGHFLTPFEKQDIFSSFKIRVWKELPKFDSSKSSLKTWMGYQAQASITLFEQNKSAAKRKIINVDDTDPKYQAAFTYTPDYSNLDEEINNITEDEKMKKLLKIREILKDQLETEANLNLRIFDEMIANNSMDAQKIIKKFGINANQYSAIIGSLKRRIKRICEENNII